MNPELYSLILDTTITDAQVIEDEKLILTTAEKTITVTTYHNPDCCEHVYGDFEMVSMSLSDIKGHFIKTMVIKGIQDAGFLLCFQKGDDRWEKIFVPCYNVQNGYYSSNLAVQISQVNNEEPKNQVDASIDLEGYINDQIN